MQKHGLPRCWSVAADAAIEPAITTTTISIIIVIIP